MSHPGNDAITIDTIIHAPIEAVWEAWTNPAIILNWFGSDPGGTGVKARMDVHPGGSVTAVIEANGGRYENAVQQEGTTVKKIRI